MRCGHVLLSTSNYFMTANPACDDGMLQSMRFLSLSTQGVALVASSGDFDRFAAREAYEGGTRSANA